MITIVERFKPKEEARLGFLKTQKTAAAASDKSYDVLQKDSCCLLGVLLEVDDEIVIYASCIHTNYSTILILNIFHNISRKIP